MEYGGADGGTAPDAAALAQHGLCSVASLRRAADLLKPRELGLSVGSHAKLQLALDADAARRERADAQAAVEATARREEAAADLAFRIEVQARAELEVDGGGLGVDDGAQGEMTIDPPQLPGGGFISLGVAAELPVERAQPAADLGARVRCLELGLGGLGVVVERQLLQPAAEDAPGVEDRQRRRRDDGAGAVAHREHEQAVAA